MDAIESLSAVFDLFNMLEEGVQRRVGGRLVVEDKYRRHDCAYAVGGFVSCQVYVAGS